MRPPHATPQIHTTRNVPDNQVDENQFYQDPETIDEPDFFSTHIPTNTPCQDQQSEEEPDNETNNSEEIVIQPQPKANVSPLLIEHET